MAIGVLAGALMLPWSQWLLVEATAIFRRHCGTGRGDLFLSVWAGCQYYTLYSRDVGFGAMIAITAVMAAVAIGRIRSASRCSLLVGGLLTPILASSGKTNKWFVYLPFIVGDSCTGHRRKNNYDFWRHRVFGTQIYFWGWYSEFFPLTRRWNAR